MYFCDLPCCSADPAPSGLNAAVGAAKLACFQITDKFIGGTIQGLSLDVSTAGSIAHSLQALREGCTDKAVMEVVTLLATKPMKVCVCSLL